MSDSPPNFTDKYSSKNPVSNYLVSNFFNTLRSFVQKVSPVKVFEMGCGEGFLALKIAEMGIAVKGVDVREEAIVEARRSAEIASLQQLLEFDVADIYKTDLEVEGADLIVCCEVFEHLPDPEKALQLLAASDVPYLIASVPREPLWRMLNICRFKYLKSFGNTPGHINQWSKSGFLRFLGQRYQILEVKSPTPWTIALCRKKV